LPHRHRGAAPRQPPLPIVPGRRAEARRCGGTQAGGAQGAGQRAAHGVAAGARDAQGFTLVLRTWCVVCVVGGVSCPKLIPIDKAIETQPSEGM